MTLQTQISKTEPFWYAIKTRYRSEKHVLSSLQENGIEAYVPLVEVVKRYRSRIKKYKVPLLKCYAFVHITQKEYVPVLETPYVLGFVKLGNEISPVKEEEIDILKTVIGERIPLSVQPNQFEVGQEVEIVAGYLTGLKGKITGKRNKLFTIQLESIGFDIQIDPKYLQYSYAG